MKIRTGFVSNSSSSSFIIACKGDLKEALEQVADSVSDEFSAFKFKKIAHEMVEYLESRAEPVTMENKEEFEHEYGYTIDELIDNLSDEYPEVMQKVKHFGWNLYRGSVSDGDVELAELLLVAMEIDFANEKIVIKKDSYY